MKCCDGPNLSLEDICEGVELEANDELS